MDLTQLAKRGYPSIEPHEIVPILDANDPLFDNRVHLAVKDEAVLNFAASGQVQPVAIRIRDWSTPVLVDGLQRWKRATIVNHLVGRHAYSGKIASVKEAIDRLKNSPTGRRIVELAGAGMKLYFSVYRAGDKEALGAKAAANAYREDDSKADRIRRAQQLHRHGFDAAEIGEKLGKSPATVARYLTLDPMAPPAKPKARRAVTRPSAKRVDDVLAMLSTNPDIKEVNGAIILLRWASGKASATEVAEQWPELAEALGAAKKAKAA